MIVHYVGWHRQGSADDVCIVVDIPDNSDLNPDYFLEHKVLMLYGRRTGKLRAKIMPWIDYWTGIKFRKQKKFNKWNYEICNNDLNVVKFKHLIPQVEKQLAWAILKI